MWTEAHENRLKELAADPDLSCKAIAAALNAEFGLGTTRNAVIGKISRLGIVRPGERRGNAAKSTMKHGMRIKRRKTTWLDEYLPKISNEGAASAGHGKNDLGDGRPTLPCSSPSTRDDTPLKRLIPLLKLAPHHCRWPIGDPPDVMFCGDERHGPLSYCLAHARKAYRRNAA